MQSVQALKIIFRNNAYCFLALMIAFLVLVLATWLPNLELALNIFGNPDITFLKKIIFAFYLTTAITTNFTWLSALYTILISLLFGVNLAMIAYMVRQNRRFGKKGGVTTVGGLISGTLGIGCAACGTLIVGPLLTFIGATGFLAILPLRGGEFGILGVAMLAWSIHLIAKKIHG